MNISSVFELINGTDGGIITESLLSQNDVKHIP